MRYLVLIFLLSGCAILRTDPCELYEVSSSLKTTKNQTICFETIDSYDLNYFEKRNINIYGKLFFPKNESKKYNAVILSHGSGGLRRYHKKYVDLLVSNGYAVFQLDHYMGRGIRYDKTFSKVSGITFMNDAYYALNLLRTHPSIEKIAYIGWSQGGVGPILSHFDDITMRLTNDIFDASIAIYPYCGFTLDEKAATSTPLLMITGRNDDLTPEQSCKNIYEKFKRDGKKIEFISIPEARHGFDNPFLFFGITFDNLPSLNIINDKCTLTISEDGKIVNLLGDVIEGPVESEKLLLACSTPGVKVKYSSKATEITAEAIISFLERKFGN